MTGNGRYASAVHRLLQSFLAVLLVLTCVKARADFELAILHPVTKIISLDEEISIETLQRFSCAKNAILEVRMRGNMMRDRLVKTLITDFAGVKKRILLSPSLKKIHVEQLRRLDDFEVAYRLGRGGLDDETYSALFALGPVRKIFILSEDFDPESLDKIRRLKFVHMVFRLPENGSFDEQRLQAIEALGSGCRSFILPLSMDPAGIFPLTRYRTLSLEVPTVHNRIDQEMLSVLKDLRGVEVIVVADGRMTLDDARQWAALERFCVKVFVEQDSQITPGLVSLLNRIAPH